MANNKNAKGKRVPKEIAGVKVPKKLRNAAAALIAKATSPAGLEVLAAGLSIAAAAASAALERERTPGRPAAGRGDRIRRGAEPVAAMRDGGAAQPPPASNDPHEIGVALGRMAEAALAGWLKGKA